ncbi:hypothetical protein FHS83_000802 [Rhizomicrobium palustre]|uniref:Uncharacterized protein n=1 Tax=Rhizomicrobium palustre TaxID=189966 RepID=A0A846MVH6_9PROT|nr:hypothetical protein [Rhizomicrobium palustre]NIK87484.1 hypothetical protein [Rhizomicrobium palustre]
MGFSIAWVAVQGKPKEDVLAWAQHTDTGEPDESNDAPASGSSLPNNWYVVFLNDIEHPLATDAALTSLSQNCFVIACHVEEHVMFSSAKAFRNGHEEWAITHDAQAGIYDIQPKGSPPAAFTAIFAQAKEQQDSEGGAQADVDHIFDVPLLTAQSVCGYKHDLWRFDWGEPKFTALKDITLQSNSASHPRRSLLRRIFGPR